MPYRPTEATRRRAEERRASLLAAARTIVAREGFAGAKVSRIAAAAGSSTGLVYSYFVHRDELLATVFRQAAAEELAVTRDAATSAGPQVRDRLDAFIRTFAGRALRGRRLAWALLFEPVSPLVETERLAFRRAYIEIAEELVRDGIAAGIFAPQHAGVSGAATIGAISEALVGRLNPLGHDSLDGVADATIVDDIVLYCHRALGASITPPKETSR